METDDRKAVEHYTDLEAGKRYRVRYRLAGQRVDRYAQLQYLAYQDSGAILIWSGRPDIGTLRLRSSEIREIWEAGRSLAVYFDRKKWLT